MIFRARAKKIMKHLPQLFLAVLLQRFQFL